MLAKDYCYWTNIDMENEDKVKSCARCQQCAKKSVKNVLCSWPIEDKPWIRAHAGFARPVGEGVFGRCGRVPQVAGNH